MRKREEIILTQVVCVGNSKPNVIGHQNLIFRRRYRLSSILEGTLPENRRGYNIDYAVTQNGKGFRWVNRMATGTSLWIPLPKEFTRLLCLAAFPLYPLPDRED